MPEIQGLGSQAKEEREKRCGGEGLPPRAQQKLAETQAEDGELERRRVCAR
jgi:hypothetical protein